MNDKELAEQMHFNIHAVRMLPNYRATEFEKKISNIVIERFKNECKECLKVSETNAALPKQEGFFNKIQRAMG